MADEQRRFARKGPFAQGFDPPHTTPHVGTVEGGTLLNMIPERAACMIEWRTIPGDDANAEVERLRVHLSRSVIPAMQAVDARTGFDFEILDALPGMALDPGHSLPTLVAQLTRSNSTGKVSYGTEGGLLPRGGHPHHHLRPRLDTGVRHCGLALEPSSPRCRICRLNRCGPAGRKHLGMFVERRPQLGDGQLVNGQLFTVEITGLAPT